MLTQRQIMILDIMQKNNSMSGIALSCLLKISERTVLREIASINILLNVDHVAEIIAKRNEGYSLSIYNHNAFHQIINTFEDDEYHILALLCLHDIISLDDIAQKLFLSRPSANKKMSDLREKYTEHFLIQSTKRGYHLEESVEVICLLLSNIIDQRGIEYLYEKNIIPTSFTNYYYDMYHDMSTHLEIINDNYRDRIYLSACLLADHLLHDEQSFSMRVDVILKAVQNYILRQKEKITLPLIEQALVKLSHEVEAKPSDKLVASLYKHLIRAITYPHLIKYNHSYIENIRVSYPFSFDMTIRFINILQKELNFSIYIDSNLLLLYFILEFEKEGNHATTFYIYSKNNSISEMNERILYDHFPSCKVVITSDIMTLSKLKKRIIINLSDRASIPDCTMLYPTHLLTNKDIEFLKSKLEHMYSFHSLLSKDLFFQLYNPKEKDECVQYLCETLAKKGLISEEEMRTIIKREHMSESLCVGNVWIPHCISNDRHAECIYIQLQHPVIVNNDEMKHILLVIVGTNFKQSKALFTSIYNHIISNYNRIKDASCFEEFIS